MERKYKAVRAVFEMFANSASLTVSESNHPQPTAEISKNVCKEILSLVATSNTRTRHCKTGKYAETLLVQSPFHYLVNR